MKEKRRECNVYRLLRIARNKPVKEVAEAIGVTPAYISAIEAGNREPSLDLIPKYARALEVDENTLFYFRNPANQPQGFERFLLAILERITKLDAGQSVQQ